LLVAEGVVVYGTSRDPSRIRTAGVVPVELNLSDMEAVGKFAVGRLPEMQIDLLVNCAGNGVFSSYWELPEGEIQDQLNVMLHAPAHLCRTVLPGMLARGNGCIVNVSSLAVHFPLPCMATYNMAKAGLSALSVSLMEEIRGRGVAVIDFQPGDFNSGFMASTRRFGGTDGAWNAAEKHLASAPQAEAIARKLLQSIRARKSATIMAGGFFQTKLAPLGRRILPDSLFRHLQRMYMG
jgi:short-subunit dehydrogenase